MDISEASKESGLPASTLRYYEEKGLIKSIGRHGLKRLYPSNILLRLSLIALGQKSGFSLQEIKSMFGEKGITIDRQKLQDKAEELDQKINELTAMRDGLRHAAKCCHSNQLDCPKFQKYLKVAQHKIKQEKIEASDKA